MGFALVLGGLHSLVQVSIKLTGGLGGQMLNA